MSELADLERKIGKRQATIGVIGLGYVGLAVACSFAEAGFQTLGVDIDAGRVGPIARGHSPFSGEEPGLAELLQSMVAAGRLQVSTSYGVLAAAEIILIAVETPVDGANQPDTTALQAACRSLGAVLRPAALVVVESTTAPGTVGNVLRPLLEEQTGRQVNEGFFLGACPERVMPGRLLANLRRMNRVCGGSNAATSAVMKALYGHIVQADLDESDTLTAELVKTTENAYRDVQIAFANEIALICQAAGADVWRVRQLVNKSPGRAMLSPGAGVGGHCIPKDPWLLAAAAGQETELRLIPAARAVNEGMPAQLVKLTGQALLGAGGSLDGATVAILGFTYKEDSDDTRHSPSENLAALLRQQGAAVVVHDPWLPPYNGDLYEIVRGSDAVIVMVAHQAYGQLDLGRLKAVLRRPVLVDGRHIVDGQQARDLGFSFQAIGVGEPTAGS